MSFQRRFDRAMCRASGEDWWLYRISVLHRPAPSWRSEKRKVQERWQDKLRKGKRARK